MNLSTTRIVFQYAFATFFIAAINSWALLAIFVGQVLVLGLLNKALTVLVKPLYLRRLYVAAGWVTLLSTTFVPYASVFTPNDIGNAYLLFLGVWAGIYLLTEAFRGIGDDLPATL